MEENRWEMFVRHVFVFCYRAKARRAERTQCPFSWKDFSWMLRGSICEGERLIFHRWTICLLPDGVFRLTNDNIQNRSTTHTNHEYFWNINLLNCSANMILWSYWLRPILLLTIHTVWLYIVAPEYVIHIYVCFTCMYWLFRMATSCWLWECGALPPSNSLLMHDFDFIIYLYLYVVMFNDSAISMFDQILFRSWLCAVASLPFDDFKLMRAYWLTIDVSTLIPI